jgi:hypothetical protein
VLGPLLVLALLFILALFIVCLLSADPGGGRRGGPPEAEARAEALLRDLLTEDERRRLERDGYLGVPSPSRPGRTYRVPRRRGQVRVYEGPTLVMTLCVGPVGWLPDGDLVLLHKLMIEGDEAEYLRAPTASRPRGALMPRRRQRARRGWKHYYPARRACRLGTRCAAPACTDGRARDVGSSTVAPTARARPSAPEAPRHEQGGAPCLPPPR